MTAPWDDGRNREGDPAALAGPGPTHVFVRSHFPAPELDHERHVVTVGGAVQRSLQLTVADLEGMAHEERVVAFECAGNGRGRAAAFVPGVQWTGGAVGRARWTGVPLSRILTMAGPAADAQRVLLGGADGGALASGESVTFERGMPFGKATDGTVLVATRMDGRPIPQEHGGPVRIVVPGWYGVASIKWLTTVTVTTDDRRTHWETVDYSYREVSAGGGTDTVPVTAMLPKAHITQPPVASVVRPGVMTIAGLAWAGEHAVASVEVSVDGGATWRRATLVDEPRPYDWTRWQVEWQASGTVAGPVTLRARCTDTAGRAQPTERDPNRGAYLFNEVLPHPVHVASPGAGEAGS